MACCLSAIVSHQPPPPPPLAVRQMAYGSQDISPILMTILSPRVRRYQAIGTVSSELCYCTYGLTGRRPAFSIHAHGVRLSLSLLFSLSSPRCPRRSKGPAPVHTSLTLPILPIHFLCDISRLALSTSSHHVGISRRLVPPPCPSSRPRPSATSYFYNSSDYLNDLLDPYHLLRHIRGSHSCITHLFRIPPAFLAYDGSSSDSRCVWAAAARLTATAVSARAAGSIRVTLEHPPPPSHISCVLTSFILRPKEEYPSLPIIVGHTTSAGQGTITSLIVLESFA